MAIVISRKTGEVLQAPAYTQMQKDTAWEALVRGWAGSHGDMLKNLSATDPAWQESKCRLYGDNATDTGRTPVAG